MSKILLISDDEFVIDDISRMLDGMGWEVCIANSREAALVTFLARPPSLVIVDVEMQGGSGLETISQMRRNARSMYILGITRSSADETLSAIAEACGANSCLMVPISEEKLSQAIEAGLSSGFMLRDQH